MRLGFCSRGFRFLLLKGGMVSWVNGFEVNKMKIMKVMVIVVCIVSMWVLRVGGRLVLN